MKGSYLLLIEVSRDSQIKIGALGRVLFQKGFYIYCGSAFNGIEHRIARHARSKKKKHWHIDYLLSGKYVKLQRAFYVQSPERKECVFAKKLVKKHSAVNGFGCSDCKCKSHLIKIY